MWTNICDEHWGVLGGRVTRWIVVDAFMVTILPEVYSPTLKLDRHIKVGTGPLLTRRCYNNMLPPPASTITYICMPKQAVFLVDDLITILIRLCLLECIPVQGSYSAG